MYCRKCGQKLEQDDRFCPQCGTKILNGEKSSPVTPCDLVNSNRKKNASIKRIIAVCAILCVIFGSLFVGIKLYNQHEQDKYDETISKAESAISNEHYNDAILLLEEAIDMKAEIPENYISLAIAYVESGDLYLAKEAITEGYEKTQNDIFEDVTIWGPMTDFEASYWTTNFGIPFWRQEYHFTDGQVKAFLYALGSIRSETLYNFDSEGTIENIAIYEHENTFYGAWCDILSPDYGYMPFGEFGLEFKFIYDENGQLVSVDCEGNEVCTIEYSKNLVEVAYSENKVSIQYDDTIPQNITLDNIIFDIHRSQDGSYKTDLPEGAGTLKYSEDGLWVEFESSVDNDAFTTKLTADGKISEVRDAENNIICAYEYSEEDLIESVVWGFSQTDLPNRIAQCEYNADGNLIYIGYQCDGTSIDGTSREITYDENGRIIEMVQVSVEEYYSWEARYTYDETGKMISIQVYDVNGNRILTPIYSRSGNFIDCEIDDILYHPGTYTIDGEGFSDGLIISVTVDYTSILSVNIDENNETVTGYVMDALDEIPQAIVAANGVDVDTVSGATITSNGIIEAVRKALEQALIDKTQ